MASSRTSGWTTPADIAAKVRRRWDDGTLLRAHLAGERCPAIDVPLRGPAAGDIGTDLAAATAWVTALTAAAQGGAAYDLQWKDIGGRAIGRNRLPSRALVASYDQAWQLLGTGAQVRRVAELHAQTCVALPAAAGWVATQPLRALAAEAVWTQLLAAAGWLVRSGGRGRYLRAVDAPGVDTKFIANHRELLAGLLDVALPSEMIDESYSRAAGFAPRYGFAEPRPLVRMRVDDGFAGLDGVSELGMRAEELARLRVRVQSVLVVENEVTYLSVPVPPDGVVVWGSGYSVGRLGRIPWLRDAPRLWLWGDLDTHGFATLSLLRGVIPRTRSLLMDRATLLAHRDRWGQEPSPTRARLANLTGAEAGLYNELIEDVHGPAVRLEQERIAWDWAQPALDAILG